MLSISHVLICLPYTLLSEVSIQVFYSFGVEGLFVFSLLILKVLYHFLDKSPLSNMWFTKSSLSVLCLFILFLISFTEQKFYILMKSNWQSFSSKDCAFGDFPGGTVIKNPLPMQGTRVWSLFWEDPTCCRATKPVRHNYWAHLPQLLKFTRLEPVLRNKRRHYNENPVHSNKE